MLTSLISATAVSIPTVVAAPGVMPINFVIQHLALEDLTSRREA